MAIRRRNMRKNHLYSITIFMFLVFTAFIIGCGNPSGGGSSSSGASTIKLTGQISGYSTTSFGSHILGTPISKVVIFNCNGGYWIANVSSGEFSIQAEAGYPVGLIFADSGNNFKGYLTMGSSIDSIPLNLLSSGSKEIDLNNIICDGHIATSEYDIIGQASLSSNEVAAMSFANRTFANLVKNPDADHNGQIDILEDGRYYRPFIMYFVDGGSFESGNLTPTPTIEADINDYRFCLDAYIPNNSLPSTISFTGPSSTGTSTTDTVSYTNRKVYFCVHTGGPNIPSDGTYNVNFNGTDLSFEVSNQTNATQYIALAIPTVSVESGYVKKISWTYKLAGGSGATIDPKSLINDLMIQMDNASYTTPRPYNSPDLSPSVNEHVPTKQVLWSEIHSMNMAYNDVFGNHIVVTWYK
jgi:hypothetical protein